MSYSRWSNGSWYVFWDSGLSGKTKEDQYLACWYSLDEPDQQSWKYERVDELLKKDFDYINHMIRLRYNCSQDEANELQEYMQIWRTDVNREYNT